MTGSSEHAVVVRGRTIQLRCPAPSVPGRQQTVEVAASSSRQFIRLAVTYSVNRLHKNTTNNMIKTKKS